MSFYTLLVTVLVYDLLKGWPPVWETCKFLVFYICQGNVQLLT